LETESVILVLLVAILVVLAFYYGWRQRQALRRLQTSDEGSPEERQFVRRMAYRRLTASVLMIVAGGLLMGSYWLTPRAMQISEKEKVSQEKQEEPAPTDQEKQFLKLYGTYWIVFLLVLLAIIVLAGLDLFATRRFGITQHRKIQSDRRAMIEGEAMRLRQDRNGHH
jgi:Na+/H+ antiporter NhaD/arsenite permease-like protein